MPVNLTILGGTPEMRTAISSAAASGLSTAADAQSKSALGQAGFPTVFGPASPSSTAYVSGVYGGAAGAMGTAAIVFDLRTDDPAPYAPNIWAILQEPASHSALTFRLAAGFWPNFVIDQHAAKRQLALSLLHEVVIFSTSRAVFDKVGVLDDASARRLATVMPGVALTSAANYLAYARPLLPVG